MDRHRISIDWLYTGNGSMFLGTPVETIPYADVMAVAGSLSTTYSDRIYEEVAVQYEPVEGDVWRIKVYGDSMYPTVLAGDILVVRLLGRTDEYKDSHIHVIDHAGGLHVKRVMMMKGGGDRVTLRSDNPDVQDFEVSLHEVRKMWLVLCRVTTAMGGPHGVLKEVRDLKLQMDKLTTMVSKGQAQVAQMVELSGKSEGLKVKKGK